MKHAPLGIYAAFGLLVIGFVFGLPMGGVIPALIDTVLCALIYPLFFVILRYAILKRAISVKKSHLISFAWCAMVWLAIVVIKSLNNQTSMTAFPLLWMEVNAAILYCGEPAVAKRKMTAESIPGGKEETAEDTEKLEQDRYKSRMRELLSRYNQLKEDVEAVKPEDIHQYYASGKITEEEYNDTLSAYREAVEEMQQIRAEAKALNAKYEGNKA